MSEGQIYYVLRWGELEWGVVDLWGNIDVPVALGSVIY